jgi:hypothetical protein
MIRIPASLSVVRSPKTERVLMERARAWLMKEERSAGIHASDLLDPRQAYWRHVDPQPLSDRLVPVFMIGKVLHAFVLSAVEGAALSWDTDQGSRRSDALGIEYSPDHLIGGIPREVKTSRSFYEPKGTDDLDIYIEQLLIYMAAEGSTKGQLWVLFLNLKDQAGKTAPQFRSYSVTVSKEDLASLVTELRNARDDLERAIDYKRPDDLPLCRPWKCGKENCEWWNKCKPQGRYGIKKTNWTK